jgi:Ca2+/Na+ antiporter
MLPQFLHGAIGMAALTIALFFLRFWRQTHDRFFLGFSAAFLLLMLERVMFVLVDATHEFRPLVYVVRLLAFVLIIAAVVDKNRKT